MNARRRIFLYALFLILKCIAATNITLDADICGVDIEGTIGTIMSPFFPNNYPPNTTCSWKITVPPQQRIILNFTHFEVEDSVECAMDRVEVRSLIFDHLWLNQGKLCGYRLPPLITSHRNTLMIHFRSDSSIQWSGFRAVFQSDKNECFVNNGGCQHICNSTVGSYICSCYDGFVLQSNLHNCTESCKYDMTSPYGVIRSPNYPDHYPSTSDCSWLFTARPGQRILLDFKDFELEVQENCENDFMAVYDGDSDVFSTLGKFCGTKVPKHVLSSLNRMYLVFKSDNSLQRKGFEIVHSTVCGGRLLAQREMEHLYSHAKYGDQNYDNKLDCDWIVQGFDDQRVTLRFLTFELEHEQDCGYDYVEIYDGDDDSAKSFGKICGNETLPEFYSSGNFLMVRFKSDDTVNFKGFLAAYAAHYSSMEDNDDLM